MTAAKKAAESKPDDAPESKPDESAEDSKPAKKGSKTYTVTAPLVAVTVGSQVLQYSNGDILPNGISKDTIDHLSGLGFIAEA